MDSQKDSRYLLQSARQQEWPHLFHREGNPAEAISEPTVISAVRHVP